MSRYISEELRHLVLTRAENLCEYCLIDHFELDGAAIRPITEIGEVTARILGFNSDESTEERAGLIEDGHYPSLAAQLRMN